VPAAVSGLARRAKKDRWIWKKACKIGRFV
jgi:hypothetical protein